MTTPTSAPINQPTADTLHLIAGDPRKEAEYASFLEACHRVAEGNRGLVHVNAVRVLLSNDYGLVIEPRRYSAFWCRATAKGGPLAKTGEWATCVHPKNGGRPQPVRRWTGPPP